MGAHPLTCGWCGWPGDGPCVRCGWQGPTFAGADAIDLRALDGEADDAPAVARGEAARVAGEITRWVGQCLKAVELPVAAAVAHGDGWRWSIDTRPMGPTQITADADGIAARLPLVALPARLQIPLLRRLLEINPRLNFTRLALTGDRVALGFDQPIGATTARLVVDSLRELLRYGPIIASELASRFAARILEEYDAAPTQPAAAPANAPCPEAAPDLAEQARLTRARADTICAALDQCLARIKPLSFREAGGLPAVLLVRALIVDLTLDGEAPDLASKLVHHGGAFLEPLWPAQESRGWLRRLARGETTGPIAQAEAMLPAMVRLLEDMLARHAQWPPEPERSLAPWPGVGPLKSQARGVVDFLDGDPLLDAATAEGLARSTLRELLGRGRLPEPLRQRMQAALHAGGGAIRAALEELAR